VCVCSNTTTWFW